MTAVDRMISFIMPSFNTPGEYLEEAVTSVLNQTYDNLELIIVDDGSSEEYWDIVQKCAKLDKRIRLIRNEQNSGIVVSLNKVLAVAEGDYIFRMDADDVCEAGRAEATAAFMEAHPEIDIAGSQFQYLSETRGIRKRPVLPETDGDMKARLLWAAPFAHPTVCFRKTSIAKFDISYGNDEKAEDYDLWVSCAIKGCKFSNIHRPLLRYRVHEGQMTNVLSDQIKKSSAAIRKKLFAHLGITLNEAEWALYNAYGDGEDTDNEILSGVGSLLGKIIDSVPERYAPRESVRKMLVGRYYHECVRSALGGNKKASRTYKESPVSEYIGFKTARTLLLKGISLVR